MANLNKTECGCEGIYNATTSSCDPPDVGVDPCPSFWSNLAGWDWQNIADTSLTWGYALGFLKPPNAQQDNAIYLMQLEQQRKQMMYLMVGLGVLMLVVVIMVLKKNKTK